MCVPGIMGTTSCKSDTDCPDSSRFTCDQNAGKCTLKENPATCTPKNGQNLGWIMNKKYCVDIDICGSDIEGNVNGVGVPNPVCSPVTSTAQCAMRDASATVAAKCDGRQACKDLSMEDFGDFPCSFPPPSSSCITGYDANGIPNWVVDNKGLRADYCGLPYIPGYAGGVPANSSTNNSDSPNSNLGYTMHGIYTCIPE